MGHLKNKRTNYIKRYSPNIKTGLNDEQVKRRFLEGLSNKKKEVPTKTIPQIILSNICTLFNILNFGLAIAVIIVGSYENALFMGVVLSNLFIGMFQEIRSKITVDKLSIIASTKADVIRNGTIKQIPIEDIVLDDIIIFKSGNQIVTDCIILDGNCDVNESFITGEADPIFKKEGDILLSGSFVVSGSCTVIAEHVGENNYASKISSGAKYIKKINSEIMRTLKKIVKFISIFIIPVGIILMYNQMHIDGCTIKQAIVQTVAAIISLIPEGLMLLSSTVLAVSVIRLSKEKVLVQELYCIETLARVDTLCLDKTGTLTEGKMELKDIIIINEDFKEKIDKALYSIVSSMKDLNPTIEAIKEKYKNYGNSKIWNADFVCPFSSQTKWSGTFFKDYGTYILGASEFIIKDMPKDLKNKLKEYSKDYRVLLMAHSNQPLVDKKLPEKITPIAFIMLRDKIRNEAKKTLEYFAEQGVDIKVISGDSVETVSGIAKHSGVSGWENAIDATKLDNEHIIDAVDKYSIFGRVTPIQKKELIIAMKKKGRTVAMTGDGVNDVLALKEADCSIAMASGADAAKNVSQLVLLNSNFDAMPKVVAEGRRSINNIQRSSSIVMIRTIYAMIISVIFLFWQIDYPFIPIQQTLINAVSSGIPGILLALEPNKNIIKGNFLKNIMKATLPPAFSIAITILLIMIVGYSTNFEKSEISTICVYVTGFIRLLFLYKVCIPFNINRRILFFSMCSIFILCIAFFKNFFRLEPFYFNNNILSLNYSLVIAVIIALVIAFITFIMFDYLCRKKIKLFS